MFADAASVASIGGTTSVLDVKRVGCAWMPRDAVVVGSGPNGLAAAIGLAQANYSVSVLEAEEQIGGGARSMALTLPGFVHDLCSAVHPLALASPFFRSLPLASHGLQLLQPPTPLAHPFDDGSATTLERSIEATASGLGEDASAYARLMRSMASDRCRLVDDLLGPLRWPSHPLGLLRFGVLGILPAAGLARLVFRGERARGMFAGLAAHSMLPLERPVSAAFGLVLGLLGHVVGWPIARGGSQHISEALAAHLRSLGGEIRTGCRVGGPDDIDAWRVALLDLTPRQVLSVAADSLPARYRRLLAGYRYGPGVFKIDWALDAPIPWTAGACSRAATVHLGGTLDEIAAAERAVWRGEHPSRPFVLLSQPSLFDSTRAPEGRHTAWAYCHVPHASTVDMTDAIEEQIERFAPGFRRRILARSSLNTRDVERLNANHVGGDINGGIQDVWQLWTRPAARVVPYTTPNPRLFICSSATPPGGGVHGMCGAFAARAALRRLSKQEK
jgi:phytoene dehydrogenase-like protein